jgi:hypothetical protein
MGSHQESSNWLLKNAGPIIRYRTAKELLRESENREIESLTNGLISNRLVQLWLDYLRSIDVHLPNYFETKPQEREAKSSVERRDGTVEKGFGRFLLRLNMMSRSSTAREHPWFKRSLSLLEGFRAENGLIAFPRMFLPEKRVGYWVGGTRMALEADRRPLKAITCESTFRYLEIAIRKP